MIVTKVVRDRHWTLIGPWGERLELPAEADGPFEIGLLGHRFGGKDKYRRIADLLSSLERPVYILDVRRDGCGAQGCWSPEHFATQIPALMSPETRSTYGYVHLPIAAPTAELLTNWRKARKIHAPGEDIEVAVMQARLGDTVSAHAHMWRHWQVFREAYVRQLPPNAVAAVRAFVEAARTNDGLAILVCAEPHADGFDAMTQAEQDDLYCHRYTLATAVVRSLQKDKASLEVTGVVLDPDAPRTRRIRPFGLG